MTYFDEQPDAPVHGECAAEIARLNKQNAVLAAMLSQFIRWHDQISASDLSKKARAVLAQRNET